MADTLVWFDNTRKVSVKCFLIVPVKMVVLIWGSFGNTVVMLSVIPGLRYLCVEIWWCPGNNRGIMWKYCSDTLGNLWSKISFLEIQGIPKNFLESGAHKAPIRDTVTWCAGYSHIGFSFLSWKQPIIPVLSEVMKRKTVESNCFVIILCYQRTGSFFIETILAVFISTVI